MRIGTVKNIGICFTLLTLFCLPGCVSMSTFERLRVQPRAADIDAGVLTQISADALEQMGYKVRTVHDTGYVLGDRSISRFIESYEMAVWIESGTERRKYIKVKCKSRGCRARREQEEVKLFFDTFDRLAQARGLSSAALRRHSAEIGVPRSSRVSKAPVGESAGQTTPVSPLLSSEPEPAPEMITFHKIDVTPPKVSPGSAFDLRMEYTVIDAAVGKGQVPVTLSYRISDGQKVFLSKPVEVKSVNGERTIRVLNLTAAKKNGFYSIEGLLSYNNEVRKRSTQLNVE